jgi:hypothetical protein
VTFVRPGLLAVLVGALLCAGPAAAHAQSAPVRAGDDYQLTTTPGQHSYDAPMLRTTGIVLTSVGLTSTLVGSAALLAGATADAHCQHGEGGFCSLGGVMVGGYMLLGSVAVLSIGIPLWVVGSRGPDEPRDTRRVPFTLSLRATSASARWQF